MLLTLEYPQEAMGGPPFSVSEAELHQLYGSCRIEQLATEEALCGSLSCYQHLYLIEE